MGGGGFTCPHGDPALDDFVLSLAAFKETFAGRACRPRHLPLFRLEEQHSDLRGLILAQDIVYVGGGSMRNLLAIWREHNLDVILREAWDAGVVLAGLSAGAMCWFEQGITRSAGKPAPAPGLGFLPGSLSVHYADDPHRRPVYLDAIARGAIPAGFGADDGVGLLYEDRTLARIVRSRPGARAYSVLNRNGRALETEIEPELLSCALGASERAVPADIREFRAARHGAGGR